MEKKPQLSSTTARAAYFAATNGHGMKPKISKLTKSFGVTDDEFRAALKAASSSHLNSQIV